MIRVFAVPALLLATSVPALAQNAPVQTAPTTNSRPQPVPIVNTIPDARDVPYPGTIKLDIDTTNVQQGIWQIKETIPVAKAGPMVLLFPEWLPGHHSPVGQIEKLAGLHIYAGDQEVKWTRDPVDVYAFHIDVPEGASDIRAEFQFLSATARNQGRIVATPDMLSLQWVSTSLYPAGYFVRQIPIEATVTYPQGFTAASALPAKVDGNVYRYDLTNYEILMDSPVIAGRYFKSWDLSPRVKLDVIADKPSELAATPAQIDAHKRLVEQAVKLFGAQHYDHYNFLLSISDEMGGIGLEHHRSSEDGTDLGYFTQWDDHLGDHNLLPHEFTHSWNGKFRRGADLWTPDYRMPMRDSLLWVYEGQTQFWGYILQARSGLVSKEDTLGALASIAASLEYRPAHTWRPLIDTTNDPIISERRPKGWVSWQRSEDYYNEGLLIWLDADSIIRAQTKGKKSMDDFARAFFGINDGDWGEVTYTFDDVVKTLNAVTPYDWAGFLKKRVYDTEQHAPLDGFTNNGYKLVFTDTPTNWFKVAEKDRGQTDLAYSIGLVVAKDGGVSTVIWDSPAFKTGMDVGDEVVTVNGLAYTGDRLKDAVTAAKGTASPIQLLLRNGARYRTVTIDYHDGLRYPRLEKTVSGEAGLDRLLQAK